jgi:hypothetical protein
MYVALKLARFEVGQKWLGIYVLFDCVIIGEAKEINNLLMSTRKRSLFMAGGGTEEKRVG